MTVVWRSVSFDFLNGCYPFGRRLSTPGRIPQPVGLSLSRLGRIGLNGMLVFRAGAGSRPASDSLSFASPKESEQRKGDPQSATSSRCEGADLRRGGCGVRRGTHCAALQLRSDSHGESVHEAAAHLRDCHPATAPAQAQPEGGGSQTAKQPNSHTGRRCARPGICLAQREAPAPARLGRAKQWPEWMSVPHPLCMRRGAQGLADQGSRLSERSEFERDPAKPEHRRLPEAKRRDADSGVALSLVTFFRRRERKLLARRATPGLRPEQKHAVAKANTGFDKRSQKAPIAIK